MTQAEWRQKLTPSEFHILREKGTEAARSGAFDNFYPAEGHFTCAGAGFSAFLHLSLIALGAHLQDVARHCIQRLPSLGLGVGGLPMTSATRAASKL